MRVEYKGGAAIFLAKAKDRMTKVNPLYQLRIKVGNKSISLGKISIRIISLSATFFKYCSYFASSTLYQILYEVELQKKKRMAFDWILMAFPNRHI